MSSQRTGFEGDMYHQSGNYTKSRELKNTTTFGALSTENKLLLIILGMVCIVLVGMFLLLAVRYIHESDAVLVVPVMEDPAVSSINKADGD